MDFQNRVGSKTGGGGATSWSESNRDRRERLRKLALETIDLAKDPYFMRNHLGTYECKLCLTLHNNEGSYLAHTQGKKHQSNLSRRAAKEAKKQQTLPAPEKPRVEIRKFVKIGRPGYKVTKQQDSETGQQSLLFQVDYPGIVEGIQPKYRVMAAYEQHIEAPDKAWQYLMFAAEPYETIAFKIPSREVDNTEGKFWNEWNPDTKQFFLQFMFKIDSYAKVSNLPPPAQLAAQGQQNALQHTDRDIGPTSMDTAPPPPPPAPTHNPALISPQTFPNLMPMQPHPSRTHFPPPGSHMPQHSAPIPPHGNPLPRPPHANNLQGPFHGNPLPRPPHSLPGPPHATAYPGPPRGNLLPGPSHDNPYPPPPPGNPLSVPSHENPYHGPPHGGPLQGPPHGRPLPGPPHGGPLQGPPHGVPLQGPPHGGPLQGPSHGGPLQGPHDGPFQGPPHGGPFQGPPHGGPLQGPHDGPLQGPPHGGPFQGPPHGGTLQGPPHGGPLQGPVHGGPFIPRGNPLPPPPPPGNQFPPPGPRM